MSEPTCTSRVTTVTGDTGFDHCMRKARHRGRHTSSYGRYWSDEHPDASYAPSEPEKVTANGETPEMLAEENETLRQDAGHYENRIEELKEQVERLTRNMSTVDGSVARDANRQAKANELLHAENERLTAELERALQMVESMKINGAQHWCQYGYQKHDGAQFVNHCKICDKPEGDPCHFQSEAKYLDSREVEKAAKEAQERLCNVLVDGMRLNHRTALNTARELLQGLPGIEGFQRGINWRPRMCNVGCGFHEDNHPAIAKSPWSHAFSWGTLPQRPQQ